jgi:hypothetical protein
MRGHINRLYHEGNIQKRPVLFVIVCFAYISISGTIAKRNTMIKVGRAWRERVDSRQSRRRQKKSWSSFSISRLYRDGILGHQIKKRLASFALSYSRSLLLVDFKEKPYSSLALKILIQKSAKQETLESIHELAFFRIEKCG